MEFNISNLVATLQKNARKNPNALAYLLLGEDGVEKEKITYFELNMKARAIAAYLTEQKLTSERILLIYPTSIDFIIAFLGCLYAGVIPVSLYYANENELQKSKNIIFAIAKSADIIGILAPTLFVKQIENELLNNLSERLLPVIDTKYIDEKLSQLYQPFKIKNNSVAYLQYTSGSTTISKAAVVSHKSLMHNIVQSSKIWHYTKDSLTLTWAPHSHVYGLVCGLLVPLFRGSCTLILSPHRIIEEPLTWLKVISKYKVTHSGAPNFAYDMCVKNINELDLKELDLSSWKVAVNGGENVNPDTLFNFSKKFSPYGFKLENFCAAYGMSELTGTIAASPYHKTPKFIYITTAGLQVNKVIQGQKNYFSKCMVSYGPIIRGLQMCIVNPDTLKKTKKNEIGEIWLAGKSLVNGYWNNLDETQKVFNIKPSGKNKVYFRTGDLGFIYKNELYMTGRLKEVIIIYGKKYYPIDLENTAATVLDRSYFKGNCAVISVGMNDQEKILFLLESSDNNGRLFEEVSDKIRKTISENHGIEVYGILFLKENTIPKTASGKLQRKRCAQLYLENKLEIIYQNIKSDFSEADVIKNSSGTPLENSKNRNEFRKQFISLIASELDIPTKKIALNKPLSVYGFDSISITKLTNELNKMFSLSITPAMLFEYSNLEEFFSYLYYQIPSRATQVPNKEDEKQIMNKDFKFDSDAIQVNERDIAVIGMHGIFPDAPNLEVFWDNLVKSKDAITEIPKERWDWQAYYGDPSSASNKTNIKWGGFIQDVSSFDADFFNISPREAELTDPQQRLFLQVVWNTIENAGYSTQELAKKNTGLFVGVFNNDYAELLQKDSITDAYVTTGTTHSILANRISYLLNLHGPSEAIDTACSSSLVAIHNAVRAIQDGDCEVAIAGGVNLLLTPDSYVDANKAGMLSEDGRCKTFDTLANGYVRGEGIAAILLKPLAQAIKEGDHIYGVIKGTAVNHGGHVSSLTAPNPNAQADVIATAVRRSGIDIETINYIETHGTGTALGDPIEISGLIKAFEILGQEQTKTSLPPAYCGLGAVKTNIGHLEAAAGMAGMIKVLLALQHNLIPGNLHFENINPYIKLNHSPFYLINQTQHWNHLKNGAGELIPRRAGISSFGFGGTNAHVIVEEYIGPKKSLDVDEKQKIYLVPLSARSSSALKQQISNLHDWIIKHKELPALAQIAYTLSLGRNHYEKRCILLVDSLDELTVTLESLLQDQFPDNVLFHSSNETKEILHPIFTALHDNLCKEISTFSLDRESYKTKLLAIGNFYTLGFDIQWNLLFTNPFNRIPLPAYPFEKQHYWLPQLTRNSQTDVVKDTHPHPIKDSDDLIATLANDFALEVANLLKIPLQKVTYEKSLSELGFDSMAFKELAVKLSNKFQIELNPAIFFTHNTVNALSKYILDIHSEKIQTYFLPSPIEKVSHNAPNMPIAIIGMQGYFPQSENMELFWEHLEAGDDLITEIPKERWDWQQNYSDATLNYNKTNSKWAGCIADFDKFDAQFFNISAREANLMDPQHRLFMEVVWRCIEDAGYNPFSLSGKNIGVYAGVEFNEYQTMVQSSRKTFHGHLATGTSPALLANRVSYFLNLNGPSEVVDTACSSALVAIHLAVTALRQGECKMAIAGGASLLLNPDTFVITSQLGALSPNGRCKTFDKSANGYVKGEGVGAVLLKPLRDAERDGDFIYGIIKGSAVNHGGKAQSLTAPNANAQSQLLVNAYTQANIDPETLSYIETHGTGTELGDPIEIEGLKNAFQVLTQYRSRPDSKQHYCGIGSVKTNIGHLEPASGIASVIKVLLAMQHAKLPGILHLQNINPYIQLDHTPFYIVEKTQNWQKLQDHKGNEIPRRAGISSFGFGGTNAHVVIEEGPPKVKSQPKKPYYLITLSGKHKESLQRKILELSRWLQTHTIPLEDLSYTLNIGKAHFENRCSMVVKSQHELMEVLQDLAIGNQAQNCFMNADTVENEVSHLDIQYKNSVDQLKQYLVIDAEEYYKHLSIIAELYTKNYSINWNDIHCDEANNKVAALPPYPFIKQRYWFDMGLETSNELPITQEKDPHSFLLSYLQHIFAETLKVPYQQIEIHHTYEVYGVDSLIGLEITNRLQQDFATLSKTILYEKNTLQDLASFLKTKYKEKVQELYAANTSITITPSNIPEKNTSKESIDLKSIKKSKDIAIIGLSGVFPEANNINAFWDNLIQGRNCITEVPAERWDYKNFSVKVGDKEKYFKYGGFIADVDKFDPLFFGIAPTEAMVMDPQERLFMQSAWSTFEDAGYTRNKLREINNNVGVFAGVTYNFYPLLIAEEWSKGNKLPLDIQMFSVANRVSYFLNLKGPSYIVDTACSSSLSAIHLACESIQNGECKMAIAGGVNLSLHPSKYDFLGRYGFLSDEGKCASFAEGGTGYVPGEGVGAVLLKSLEQAIEDNDRIYGVIKSSSMNHGGKTSGYTVPNPNAQADLVLDALRKANINPRSISYIEAHGTGTALGDPIEVKGLQEAFEQYTEDKQFCALGSVKSNIGHLESAAGISQLAKVIMQLKYKKLVPSLHAEQLNPFIDFKNSPFYVQREVADWKSTTGEPLRAGLSSFGAGGTNVHLIIEEYSVTKNAHPDPLNFPFIFVLSAKNSDQLGIYANEVYEYLYKNQLSLAENVNVMAEICYTSQVGRESMEKRLAILATHYSDLVIKLEKFIAEPAAKRQDIYTAETDLNKQLENLNIAELIKNSKWEQLIQVWVNGGSVAWQDLYNADHRLQIGYLPTYPFAKRSCWVSKINHSHPEETQTTEKSTAEWLYKNSWEKTADNLASRPKESDNDNWLIFSEKELGFILQDEFLNPCTYVFESESYEQIDNNTFYLNGNSLEDYEQLFHTLEERLLANVKGIIYLWPLDNANQNDTLGYKLLLLFQSLTQFKYQKSLKFCLVTRGSQFIESSDEVRIWQHHLWSLTRIFAAEQGKFDTLLLDLDAQKELRKEAKMLGEALYHYQNTENHIAYRNNQRYKLKLSRIDAQMAKENFAIIPSVLVTGGLGALGAEIAKWLVSKGTRYLLLTGTTFLPDRSEWAAMTEPGLVEKINTIIELESAGATVIYAAVDVANKEAMQSLVEKVEKDWGQSIKGVFHLAGVTTDSIPMEEMSVQILKEVTTVKIQGALVLHEIFNKPTLSQFILFSSIAALPFFGMRGLCAYAMGNEFLNGLAQLRQHQGLVATSICWAAWSEKGMSHRYDHGKFLEAVGMSTISIQQGLKIFAFLLSNPLANTIVFKIQWDKFFQVNAIAKKITYFENFNQQVIEASPISFKKSDKNEIHQIVIQLLMELLQLSESEIDPQAPFSNYGLDSIIGINFIAELGKNYSEIVSPMDLYRYPNVHALVNYIFETIETNTSNEKSNTHSLEEVLKLDENEISRLIDEEMANLDEQK